MKFLLKNLFLFSFFVFLFLFVFTGKSNAGCPPTISYTGKTDGTLNVTYNLSINNSCATTRTVTLVASVPDGWSYFYQGCATNSECPIDIQGNSTKNTYLWVGRPVGENPGSYPITAGIQGSNSISLPAYLVQQEKWVCYTPGDENPYCGLQLTPGGEKTYDTEAKCSNACKSSTGGGGLTACPKGSLSTFAPGGVPTGGLCMLNNVIRIALTGLLVISVILALAFLIFGGIKWITSGGDKTGVETARKTLTYAIIGLAIALASYFILNFVSGFFGVNYTP